MGKNVSAKKIIRVPWLNLGTRSRSQISQLCKHLDVQSDTAYLYDKRLKHPAGNPQVGLSILEKLDALTNRVENPKFLLESPATNLQTPRKSTSKM
jgi:hypothetical protein